MSILVWSMVGIAMWHFAVLVPDRFYGGIMGALVAALAGALLAGYMLPTPGLSSANPPGVQAAMWPAPGAVIALAVAYWYGERRERRDGEAGSTG